MARLVQTGHGPANARLRFAKPERKRAAWSANCPVRPRIRPCRRQEGGLSCGVTRRERELEICTARAPASGLERESSCAATHPPRLFSRGRCPLGPPGGKIPPKPLFRGGVSPHTPSKGKGKSKGRQVTNRERELPVCTARAQASGLERVLSSPATGQAPVTGKYENFVNFGAGWLTGRRVVL